MHATGAAACETVNVWPAAVIMPVRAAPVLAATLNATVPLPLPEVPLEIVIQATLDDAVQAQVPVEDVTAIEPLPPLSDTV